MSSTTGQLDTSLKRLAERPFHVTPSTLLHLYILYVRGNKAVHKINNQCCSCPRSACMCTLRGWEHHCRGKNSSAAFESSDFREICGFRFTQKAVMLVLCISWFHHSHTGWPLCLRSEGSHGDLWQPARLICLFERLC